MKAAHEILTLKSFSPLRLDRLMQLLKVSHKGSRVVVACTAHCFGSYLKVSQMIR